MTGYKRQLEGEIQATPPLDASLALILGGVVLALYFGREILIPLALAVLVSFALAPLVSFFRRLRLGRIVSVILVVVIATVAVGAITALVTSQLVTLAQKIPTYEQNLRSQGLEPPGRPPERRRHRSNIGCDTRSQSRD